MPFIPLSHTIFQSFFAPHLATFMISKQQLGNYLWGMADILYGKVEDYKSYILTLLFFKRLSDNYSWEEEMAVRDAEITYGPLNAGMRKAAIKNAHTFKIPDGHFWSDVKLAPTSEKNERLQNACQAIADANPVLKGIINAVRWNEPAPDGSGRKRLDAEVLQNLINYLDPQSLSNDRVPLDILGHAYEYLIGRFADENRGGTVAGQFYTPTEVVDLIIRTLKPRNGERAYDPTCGSGGFLIKAANYIKEKEGVAKGRLLFGQETIWTTWAIATMNLILHGLEGKIAPGDTIRDPKFLKEDGSLDQFDIALANFPFSLENWAGNGTPKTDKKGRPDLNKDGSPKMEYPSKDTYTDRFNRLVYGVPAFSNGDFAFIQHIIASLNDTGRAGVVCPNGVLFKGQPEKTEDEDGQKRKADDDYLIRRGFLEGVGDLGNIVDAVVALPENIFYGNTIPGCILFFNKAKPAHRKDKVLMVWGAREGWYKEEPDQNVLRPQDVMRLLVILESYGDIEEARRIIPVEEARLCAQVDERLSFRVLEIEEKYADEQEAYNTCTQKLTALQEEAAKNPKAKKQPLQKAEARLAKLAATLAKRDKAIQDARSEAVREQEAIRSVSVELLTVMADPEQRRRYYAIVDMEDIRENEYNLNLPRYVDTIEPEEPIPFEEAVEDLDAVLKEERKAEKALQNLITPIFDAV